MSTPRIAWRCRHCGSDDVTRDGVLAWNAETQTLEIVTDLQNEDCGDCGASGDVIQEVPV